jgi:hypothetical protein
MAENFGFGGVGLQQGACPYEFPYASFFCDKERDQRKGIFGRGFASAISLDAAFFCEKEKGDPTEALPLRPCLMPLSFAKKKEAQRNR